jgi:hypothetical protein
VASFYGGAGTAAATGYEGRPHCRALAAAVGCTGVSEDSRVIVGRKEEIPPCGTRSSVRALSFASSDRAAEAVSNAGRCQTVLPLMRTRLDIRPALTGGDTDFGSRAHAGNLPPWGKARGKIPCTPHYCLTDKPHRTCAPAYGLGFSAFLVRFSTLRPDDHCAESASPGGSGTSSLFPSSWFQPDPPRCQKCFFSTPGFVRFSST